MTTLTGTVHTIAASLAIVAGAAVLLRPKGTAFHRRLGYVYALCMTTVVVTSFAIYRLTGRFNFLHLASLLSAITLSLGLAHAISKRPAQHWRRLHYTWMSWSYIGLLAAFIAEVSTRAAMPWLVTHFGPRFLTAFWIVVGLVTGLVVILGRQLIENYRPR